MKKIFTIIILSVLVLSLVGCETGINIQGTPQQEIADRLISEKYSDAVFKEMVKSDDGESYNFYYEAFYENESTTVEYFTITYTVNAYYDSEMGEWKYSTPQETDRYYEWDIAGTWYPIFNEYTNNIKYSNCVMYIDETETNVFHIRFEKNGEIYFDETMDFNGKDSVSFDVDWSGNVWNDFNVSIGDKGIGTEGSNLADGCLFERE